MKGRRHTPEQVVRKLREADRLLGEGFELPDVLKGLTMARCAPVAEDLAGAAAVGVSPRARSAAR